MFYPRSPPPGPVKTAYLQASLHADELPGIVVLDHLGRKLREAEALGRIRGHITLAPYANPIGLAQWVGGYHMGRYEVGDFKNFNRDYPDITDTVAARLSPTPTVAEVRQHMTAVLEAWPAPTALDRMRIELLKRAIVADICLDLHCDFDAGLHLYLGTPLWPAGADLAAALGAIATLTAEVSGGNPFDEAAGGPWWALSKRFPGLPPACFAATVELRGVMDVSDTLAERDAAGIYDFLVRRGLIADTPGPLPPLVCDATPLSGVAMVRVEQGGVLIWRGPVGAWVEAGECLGEVLLPGEGRVPVLSPVAGVVYGRVGYALVRPNQIVAKVAGKQEIRSGHLLTD